MACGNGLEEKEVANRPAGRTYKINDRKEDFSLEEKINLLGMITDWICGNLLNYWCPVLNSKAERG